jgi:hypothetical protein
MLAFSDLKEFPWGDLALLEIRRTIIQIHYEDFVWFEIV